MDLKNLSVALLALALLLFPLTSLAQLEDEKPEDIIVTVNVNYGSFYREGSWVPIDVLIDNNKKDVKGRLEIKTFTVSDIEQSPTYRIPIESYKGSIMRFRATCRLENTSYVLVQLYNKKKPVFMSPIKIPITPIGAGDYLTLVLDNDVTHHGFISGILLKAGGKQRFYREQRKNKDLPYLADYPQCYRSFNVIIIGAIDPNRIGEHHRALLRRYVDDGGVLVLYTGRNSPQLKGTWVEDLFGIEIGSQELLTEAALASSVFFKDQAKGARKDKSGMVAELIATSGEVEEFGRDRTLATRRKIGRGYAVAFSTSATSRMLQKCDGFRNMWQDIYVARSSRLSLNYPAAGDHCTLNLPNLVGITIQPRSSVFLYLGLYFVVAIVANWLFWNQLKRREMAWVFLVVFSIGFTAYAMYFGTVGRGRVAELDQIEVLHVPEAGSLADRFSFIGLLTPGTSRLNAETKHQYALITDVSLDAMRSGRPTPGFRRPMGFGGGEALEPFDVEVGDKLKVEGLRVRASEMRILGIESMLDIPGGAGGTLTLDDEGMHGKIDNHSGFKLDKPHLFYNGHIYPVRQSGDGFEVSLSRNELRSKRRDQTFAKVGNAGRDKNAFKNGFIYRLLSEEAQGPGQTNISWDPNRGQVPPLSNTKGPFIFGYTSREIDPVIGLERSHQTQIRETLVALDIVVEQVDGAPEFWRDLPVMLENVQINRYNNISQCGVFSRIPQPRDKNWSQNSCQFQLDQVAKVSVRLDDLFARRAENEIVVDVFWNRGSGASLSFYPVGGEPGDGAAELIEQSDVGQGTARKRSYSISDFSAFFNTRTGYLEGEVAAFDADGAKNKKRRGVGMINVTARIKQSGSGRQGGEWPSWR